MKKVVVILITLFMLYFCGCKNNVTVKKDARQEESMFIIVEDAYYFSVVYQRDTKVMYVISRGSHNSGSFCLLVNPDGTPMLWEEK